MAYIYDLTDTWNAGGTTFNAIKMNVTDSASAVTSKLVSLQTNGTEHFSVTKAGVGYVSGNLGVGTASPSYKLDVSGGDMRLATNATYIRSVTSGGTTVRMLGINSGNTAYVGAIDSGPVDTIFNASTSSITAMFYTGGSERMRIDSSGNLGIGTSAPAARLHVVNSVIGNQFRIQDNTTDATGKYGTATFGHHTNAQAAVLGVGAASLAASNTIYVGGGFGTLNAATSIQFYTAANNTTLTGSERMRIDSSGNLGIGTSSMAAKFVVSNGGAAGIELDPVNGFISSYNRSTSAWTKMTTRASSYTFNIANSNDAVNIDASGNLLVGTTSSGYGGRFVVIKNGGDVVFAAQTASGGYCYKSNAANNGGSYYHMEFQENGTARGSISSNGTAVAYNTTSDARLKDNIENADDASSLIDAIQVRKFDWKSNGSHQRHGFIAQELIEVAPEAVNQPEDPDTMMGVDYSKLVPMLVKEIQSLRARVAQLEGN